MTQPIRVGIVPHTHWDREWHEPFPVTRLRLVRLLDELLPDLEADTSGTCVCLDGQTALVDDYLELRPGAEAVIRRLLGAGRLSVGPFTVPPDQFCVSGETLVRNLEAGMSRAAELGGAMAVGYLPDCFGHAAQLPQLLLQAGIDHAVVWRGVPGALETTAFWWEAPDGSRVRAEHLYGSYANGRRLPGDAGGLVARAAGYDAEVGDARVGGLLLMNGGDQRMPQLDLAAVAARANRTQSGYRLEVTALDRWLAAEPAGCLPTWRGELRSGARAHLLPGVVSTRVDLKRAAAAAERALERVAEPLLALFRSQAEWVAAEPALRPAWRLLVLNSAHDSACGCVADAVAEQVANRYAQALQTAEALASEALTALAGEVDAPAGAVVVANTVAHARRGLVEMEIGGEPWPGAQVLDVSEREVFAATVSGRKVGWVLDMVGNGRFDGRPVRFFDLAPGTVTLRLGQPAADLSGLADHLRAVAAGGGPVTIRAVEGPVQRVLLDTGEVPGLGWTTLRRQPPADPLTPVRAGDGWLDNGLVRVEVDPGDASLRVVTTSGISVSGLHRLVDGGDGGDTYNYSPPSTDTVVDAPESVIVHPREAGPLRGRLITTARYRWPAAAIGDEVACTARTEAMVHGVVRTTVGLVTGDPVVHLEVEIDNPASDHRLRTHFPLPAAVDGSEAECAFAVVHRPLRAEDGPVERGMATFPARRFVDCSDGKAGLAVISDSVLEYEVVEGGTVLAVTLLRAVGFLSRRRPALRPEPAGPPLPVPGAQLRGTVRRTLGFLLHTGGWERAALYRRADDVLVPMAAAEVGGTSGRRAGHGQTLAISGAEVSAVLRRGDDLLVRIFNPSGRAAAAQVGGQPVTLRPGQIATVTVSR
ncbi:MAG TPA: glycoside hydrolase family 38 C-terminal domain-containing protein [Acidimicrobiia bacterium]